MSVKTPVRLLNFFVFNSSFGPREDEEHKRILYFYPPDTNLSEQIWTLGLSEAVTRFTHTFNKKEPCESLHTQKTRQLFYNPEGEYWILTYRMFRLFLGTFTSIMDHSLDVAQLKFRLEHFYSKYLLSLKLEHADILDIFQGLHFLPLDRQLFLKVQCFINQLEAKFSFVKHSVFLYNDQLVWSGLEQGDVQVLFHYLTTNLLPAHLEIELQTSQLPMYTQHYGRFVTGAQGSGVATKLPHVILHSPPVPQKCQLLVYNALSATVCLLVDADLKFDTDLYKQLDVMIGPQLSTIASEIADQCSKKSTGSDTVYRYIYFNSLNLAQKSTIHLDTRHLGNTNVTSDTLHLLTDVNTDLMRLGGCGEVAMKTQSDVWVVGRMSYQRQFYVVILHKSANLIEVNEEVENLCVSQFSNIFILD